MGQDGNELRKELEEQRRTSADGLGPKEKKGFFLNSIFNAKTFPRKCFKA
jgi:hypothetical protein